MSPSSAAELSCPAPSAPAAATQTSFRHEMMFYADGDHGFLDGALELVRHAVAQDAGVLVAVGAARAQALSEALGDLGERVRFADMLAVGRNPARIMSLWQEFAREHALENGGALGIGEPVWPGRRPAELVECERHEELLNFAFDYGPGWRLLCSYDVDRLSDDVIEAAKETHPLLARDGISHCNEDYVGVRGSAHPFDGALPPARGAVTELAFACASLAALRRAVADWAAAEHGLDVERTEELVLAVDELATNSIRHGGGAGTVRCWREAEMLLCEVRDAGWIEEPMVGRSRPSPDALNGRGVWLVNQLCDLVQIRSAPAGSVVRVHKLLT